MTGVSRELRQKVAQRLGGCADPGEDEIYDAIDGVLGQEKTLELEEKVELRRSLFHSFRGLDILDELIEDEGISEIMVNGSRTIFLERGNRMELWNRGFEEKETLDNIIQIIAAGVNRLVNTSVPIADLRLPDGSRVNIVLPPVAPDGPVLTIRKFNGRFMDLNTLTERNMLTPAAAALLREAVRAGLNIFISGGTGSGKTTFLNALSAFVPAEERVITIEDSLELQLQNLPNLVRLETREANLEGDNAIGIRRLIRTALRMRPDRIIVGEVRGEEALDMLQAMNTGHRGSLSTGHANSARDMLSRLETMSLMGGSLPLPAVRAQIASAIDLVVHLGRLPDKTRCVLEIMEVKGLEEGNYQTESLFRFEPGRGLVFRGRRLSREEKWLEYRGSVPQPAEEGYVFETGGV